jgi:hypothetical protein
MTLIDEVSEKDPRLVNCRKKKSESSETPSEMTIDEISEFIEKCAAYNDPRIYWAKQKKDYNT